MDKEIKRKNDLALKLRCRELLKTKEGENKPEWKKVYGELYATSYSVQAGEEKSYPVVVDLFKFSRNDKAQYILAFSDIPQQLYDQRYKPLRELGKLIFN
jgi:hypothetical protein